MLIGEILSIKIDNDKLTLKIKSKEKIIVSYYLSENEDISYLKIGDTVKIEGEFEIPKENTNFNLFNYKNYLLSEKIYFTFSANKITFVKNTNNLLIKIKNNLIDYIDRFKSKNYLHAFILGNLENIDENIKNTYRSNGISHLFAISGMHVSLISSILFLILNFFIKNKNYSYIIIIVILMFYLFITDFSPSILRSFLLFLFLFINKKFNLNFKNMEIIIFILCVLLIYNPFYIYNIGFIFSFLISISLIYYSKKINSFKNYFSKLFITSLISFLISLPILINNFFEVNLFSPFINLIFVPIISIFIFPLSLITLVIPVCDTILFIILNIMESISLFISNNLSFIFIFKKMNIFIICIYYIVTIFVINKLLLKKYIYILFLIISLLIYSNINIINNYLIVTMLDVGQGDSILIELPNNKSNILIDTGGKYNSNFKISENIIIPYLKSVGIKKLDYLILTHGDYDHMGEAINLVENFKVEKVIFNCGPYNDLEKELIKVLNKKHIKYYSCIKELNIDKNKLYFLQTEEYDNENDNSNVIYTELNGYKFMFMGDASINTEKEILNKYNLPDIDVLKVGHHGSKTSSSKEYIDEINPKYSIISVGKNNRYGHPNKEVIDNLIDSKIYRTDQDGSIMFKIKNNKLKIETCSP